MKKSNLITGAFALISLSFSTAAMADEEGAKKERPAGEARPGRPEGRGPVGPGGVSRADMLKKLDTDGDGRISNEERLAGMKERIANSEEMKKRLLERFDEDKNGELSDTELDKAVASFSQRGAGRPGGEGRPGERPTRRPGGPEKDGAKPESKPEAAARE